MELAQTQASITRRFYLTGGTALAEFYLNHRLSEDIDLFCEKEEVNPKVVEAFLQKISPQLSVINIKRSQFLGLVNYKLIYKDGGELKVDFNYYPFPRIEKGTKYKNIEIYTIPNISPNKIHTLFMKPRARDYIDLYFLIKKQGFSLGGLIADAKEKFDWDIDKVNLANQLLRVRDFSEFPKMFVQFNRQDMEKFFTNLAKSLEKEIFKG